MPFIGYVDGSEAEADADAVDGREVFPDEIDDDDRVACVSCDDEMYVRRGHWREGETVWVSRHFVHRGETGGGGGRPCVGESDAHKRMKYVASRTVPRWLEADHADVSVASVEREVTVPGTTRRADVRIDFDEPRAPLGRGVAVEIQYRNEGKDTDAVEREYLEAGYAVLWLEESDFNDSHAELVRRVDPVPVWPTGMPSWRADTDAGVTGPAVDAPGIDAGAAPSLRVPIPLEYFEARRDDLYGMWRAGAGQFDLVRRLSSNSADRTCETCGGPAAFYLFTDHGVSTFRCDDHIPVGVDPDAPATPAGGERA